MPASSRIRCSPPFRPGGKNSGGAAAKQDTDSLWTVRALLPSGDSPAGSRSECFVFRVAHRLAPLVGAHLTGHLDGDVAEPAVPLCAVPVLDIGRDRDDRTGLEADSGPPLLLIPALAGRADQELASAGRGVMDVPVVAAARLKGDVCKKDGLLRIGQRIEEGRAGKILRVGGVFRAPAKDVFLFKCGFILNFRDPCSFPLQSFSNSFATSSSSWRMGRCCGQTFSHLPHFTQSDALRPGAVCTSL